jgi:hypothetical protein
MILARCLFKAAWSGQHTKKHWRERYQIKILTETRQQKRREVMKERERERELETQNNCTSEWPNETKFLQQMKTFFALRQLSTAIFIALNYHREWRKLIHCCCCLGSWRMRCCWGMSSLLENDMKHFRKQIIEHRRIRRREDFLVSSELFKYWIV